MVKINDNIMTRARFLGFLTILNTLLLIYMIIITNIIGKINEIKDGPN